ncbi:MAG: glycosyltransferase family 2 protein, partial [Lacisediminihabitans sp.]
VIGVLQVTAVLHGWPSVIVSAVYLAPLAYLLLVLWVSLTQDDVPERRNRWLFLIVLPTMHLAWGTGFIVALLRGARQITDTSRTGI